MSLLRSLRHEKEGWVHHLARHDFSAAFNCSQYWDQTDHERYKSLPGATAHHREKYVSSRHRTIVIEDGVAARQHRVYRVANPKEKRNLGFVPGTHVFSLEHDKPGTTWLDRVTYRGQLPPLPHDRIGRLHVLLADIADIVICLVTFEAPATSDICEELGSIRAKKGHLSSHDIEFLHALWSATFAENFPKVTGAVIAHVRPKLNEAAHLSGPQAGLGTRMGELQRLLQFVAGKPLDILKSCWLDAMELEAKTIIRDEARRPDERVLIYQVDMTLDEADLEIEAAGRCTGSTGSEKRDRAQATFSDRHSSHRKISKSSSSSSSRGSRTTSSGRICKAYKAKGTSLPYLQYPSANRRGTAAETLASAVSEEEDQGWTERNIVVAVSPTTSTTETQPKSPTSTSSDEGKSDRSKLSSRQRDPTRCSPSTTDVPRPIKIAPQARSEVFRRKGVAVPTGGIYKRTNKSKQNRSRNVAKKFVLL